MQVVAPVVAGASIYLLWRTESLLVFRWLAEVGLLSAARYLRHVARPVRDVIPSFVVFSLPDALWCYGFTAVLRQVWSGRVSERAAWFWGALPLVLGCGSEVAQRLRLLPGTFDPIDLCASALSIVIAYRYGGVPPVEGHDA
jgi:hypothetical protein